MSEEKIINIIAGTLAGWAVVTVGQPMDYIKTMYQIKSHHLPSMQEMYRDIGLRGFYKGASSLYLFAGLTTALQFQAFQWSWNYFTNLGFKTASGQPSVMSLVLSGLTTGAAVSTVYTPIEYAKIHSQIQHTSSVGSSQRIWNLIKNEGLNGLRKLYIGHSITCSKQSVGFAVYYGGYHLILERVLKQERQEAETWAQMFSGSIAGIVYQLYSYPLDTIKTNVQSGKKSFGQMMHSKFWRTANFRNGLKISILRSAITDSTNFTVYQKARSYLFHRYQKPSPQ